MLLPFSPLVPLPLVPPPKRDEELLVEDVLPSLAHPDEEAPPARPRPFSASASHSVSPDEVPVEVAAEDVAVAVADVVAVLAVLAARAMTRSLLPTWTGAAKVLANSAARAGKRRWQRMLF